MTSFEPSLSNLSAVESVPLDVTPLRVWSSHGRTAVVLRIPHAAQGLCRRHVRVLDDCSSFMLRG